MSIWLAAIMLLLQTPADLAGAYRTEQMETEAALELNGDGTFRYQLDYGAVSEAAQGHWTLADGSIELTSDPLAVELQLEIERSDAAFDGQHLSIEDGALVMRRHDTLFTFYREDP